MPLLSLLELALYRWRSVLAVLIAIPAIAFAFTTLMLLNAPVYTASSKVSVLPTNSQLAFANEFVRGSPQLPANLISMTHMENLISRPIAQRTIDAMLEKRRAEGMDVSFDEAEPTGFALLRRQIRAFYNRLNSGKHVQPDPYTDTILTLQDSIKVELIEGTYLMQISVSWDDPDRAAEIANMLSEVYVDELRARTSERNKELEDFVTRQMRDPAAGPAERGAMQSAIIALRLGSTNARGNLRLVEPAVAPAYPSAPKVVVSTVIAAAFAICLVAFGVVAFDTFSTRMLSLAHLRNIFGERALGPVVGAPFLRMLGLYSAGKAITKKIDLLGLSQNGELRVHALGNDASAEAAADALRALLKSSKRNRNWTVMPAGSANGTMNQSLPLSTNRLDVLAIPRNSYSQEEVQTVVSAFGAGSTDLLGFYVKPAKA